MADTLPITSSLFGISPESLQAQRQAVQEAQAMRFAQLDPAERATYGFYRAGQQTGNALAGLMGAQDPELEAVKLVQSLGAQYDKTTPEGLGQLAQALQATGNPYAQQFAVQAADRAMKLQQTAASIAKDEASARREAKQSIPPDIQKAQAVASLRASIRTLENQEQTPEVQAAIQQYKDQLGELEYKKPPTKGEFETLVDGLNIPAAQKEAYKQQYVLSKLNNDPQGIKALNATVLSLDAQMKQQKLDDARSKAEEGKKATITKLADTESSLETALVTAEKAAKLAPGSFVGAVSQSAFDKVPWSDAKALSNLVASLQSEKVMGALEQLKAQSRTGATGFGSLTEKELNLIMSKIRTLDPSDKMFKENLTVVMEEWRKIQQKVRNNRREMQGQAVPANAEDLIKRTIDYNKSKGRAMTRADATQLLKQSGKLPEDY